MKSSGMFSNGLTLVASCASGVEKVLKKEIERLGYGDNPAENGLITFSGDMLAVARSNIFLRTADRVFVQLYEFNVLSFDELFDKIKNISWEDYITVDGKVDVNGKCVKSRLFSISDCQRIIKKAIADRLCVKYHVYRLEENGARYEVCFSIFKDTCKILLNTSGVGLHKRGYRDLVGIAPIKETLASSLLLMSDFYYKRPFVDPFCGSGTMVIEGAKIALDIAPNLMRRFDFNEWKNFDGKYYDMAYAEAKDKEKRDRKIDFIGYDIDPKAIKLAKRHAINAGIDDKVSFEVKDVKNLSLKSDFGTIVTNPPYGERVYDKEEAEECYKSLGRVLKNYSNWSLFLITSDKSFEKKFGRRAERIRKMYNSNKECNFYYYYGKEK